MHVLYMKYPSFPHTVELQRKKKISPVSEREFKEEKEEANEEERKNRRISFFFIHSIIIIIDAHTYTITC